MKKHRFNNYAPRVAHYEAMKDRRQKYNDYLATIPPLVSAELGKYIPAGQYKNV